MSPADERTRRRPGGARAQAALETALRDFFADPEELDAGDLGLGELGEARGDTGAGVLEYLSFRLAEERFALPIAQIREIIKVPLITRVPRTEPFVLGVLSLRGTIVPAVDLRMLLRQPASPQTRRSRVLVYMRGGELVGLLVDEVHHVLRLGEADIEAHPFGARPEVEPVMGVGRKDDEIVALLDLHAALAADRFVRRRQDHAVLSPEG
ncbi:MAG TPA: chemotaxis protein CheW [Myxococcota bacterium]|nr:chemotaxis protein CheW [Myxococcota bacterium]